MRQPRSFLFLLFCACSIAFASNGQSFGDSSFTHYTRTEGLSNNYISGIVQDSLGYIWVATRKGLNRFDGRFFTSYYTGTAEMSLPANHISMLKMQGEVMIGSTVAGAFVYNPGTRDYHRLTVPCDPSISYWANDVYEATRDRRGNYVVSTKTGLYVFDSTGVIVNRYDHYLPADAGRQELIFGGSLYEYGNGDILQENAVVFSNYEVDRNRIDTFFANRQPELKKALLDRHQLHRLCYAGRKDELLIHVAEKNTLDAYDLKTGRVWEMPLPFDGNKEIDEGDSKIIMLTDSLIAITCKASGVYVLHYRPGTHTISLCAKYLEGKQCTTVFKDREGRLWVGTNEGLYKENLSSPFFTAYDLSGDMPDLRNCNIRTIWTDSANLFVGLRNKGGVLVLDKETKQIKRRIVLGDKEAISNDINLFIPYSADTLWVGTRMGLFWVDRKRFTSGRVVVPPALAWIADYNTLCFCVDRQKDIWISFGRLNSVVRYDPKRREFLEISERQWPQMKITYCFSMGEDLKGNMWLGGDGLCRWNGRKEAIDTLIPYPSLARKLPNYALIIDCDEKNNLWLYSFNNGILQFNCDNYTTEMRKEENYLTDGDVLNSSCIIHGNIWLGMENGIMGFNIRNGSSRSFPYTDGLPTVAITSTAKGFYYDERENIFYFGSKRHLISFRPDLPLRPQKTPSLFFDGISTAKGTVPANSERIELSNSDNNLQINFNAVNFTNPEGNRFAYRLTPGTDTGWRLLNWQRSVSFNNLAPGEYHVTLKLFSANNRWPDQMKSLTIIVYPPLWKRWWFLALAGILLLATVLMIYRIRVGRLREKLSLDKQMAEYEMKALHAQMNPHFIFNALNSIREMILHEDNRNASRYLSRFARLIRLNLEHSRQTFITLRQNNEYLASYLEMEQLRFSDFSYRIITSPEADVDIDEIRLAPMLIQPLVENAIWHGLQPKDKDKQLLIQFYLDSGRLVCEIDDNGIGIRQSLQNKDNHKSMHRSMGIANIRQRIAVLNEKYQMSCSLSIRDKADIPGRHDSGTLITLSMTAHEEEMFV
ncbi:histidine kinase [Puia sp.]|jgi:ligand-binding sensor domain-containing protein|uniref:histidine kinase n=1 Tax=Puia sp. TaxID=2045100 RepID=UPI002F4167C2